MSENNDEIKHVCVYCGQPASFQFKNGKWCCSHSMSSCPANKKRISQIVKTLHAKQLEKTGSKVFNKGDVIEENQNQKYQFSGEHICVHCGQYAEYKLKNNNWCCKPFANQCPEVRKRFANKPETIKNRNYKEMYQNLSDEVKLRMKTIPNTKEVHKKAGKTLHERYKTGLIIPHFKGKHHTQETKDKIRISTVKYLEEVKRTGGAKFSKRACLFIDKLNESKGWHLQHALNGGEIIVGGYYLDGYDKELNIAFEYNESKHYIDCENNILREKDIIRMNFIHNKLNCRFFIYNEKKDYFYEVNFTEKMDKIPATTIQD